MTRSIPASVVRPAGSGTTGRAGHGHRHEGDEPAHRSFGVRDPAQFVQFQLFWTAGQELDQRRLVHHVAQQPVAVPGQDLHRNDHAVTAAKMCARSIP
ncbi:hypothetical protein ACWGE0_22815 [Lentzea sp. NPDC054927]